MAKGSTLGKNPAVDWFFNDWHGGTVTMTRFVKGCYMDLMHAQFNNGHLSLDEVRAVLGSDFGSAWPTLQKKFRQDENGLFFQARLETQILKKISYSKTREDNLNGDSHMGNGNGSGIEERKRLFLESVKTFTAYSEKMRNEFCDYWTEMSPSGKKMLFETKKTFEIGKRLGRWASNADNWSKPTGKAKAATGNFPDEWSKSFEDSIKDGKTLQLFWQHLHSKGLRPKKNHYGDTIAWVPEDQLRVA